MSTLRELGCLHKLLAHLCWSTQFSLSSLQSAMPMIPMFLYVLLKLRPSFQSYWCGFYWYVVSMVAFSTYLVAFWNRFYYYKIYFLSCQVS
jgi:hypothetical protein